MVSVFHKILLPMLDSSLDLLELSIGTRMTTKPSSEECEEMGRGFGAFQTSESSRTSLQQSFDEDSLSGRSGGSFQEI
jgi:hypothetical protein